MSARSHIAANVTFISAIALAPWLEDLLKIYLIVAVVLVAVTINVALRVARIRDLIVEHVIQSVINKVMMDKDVQEVFRMKFIAMAKQVRDNEATDGSHSK